MSQYRKSGLWLFIIDNYLLLVIGTVVALLWANLDYGSYERVAHALHFPVNDIGMAFFFALATKEIVEAMLPGGALASLREAGVPVLAAIGGMAAPAGLYAFQVSVAGQPDLMPGCAIRARVNY
jgi:Na+:H+ antiporter, NhaA family